MAKRVPRAPPGAGAARVRSPVSWEAASDDAEAAPEGTDPEAGPARFGGPQRAGRVRQQVERVQPGRVEIVYAVIAGADLEPVNDGACSARALDRAPQPSPEAEGAARVGIRCEYSKFLWPEPADGKPMLRTPATAIGSKAMKPASGPASPISNRARRVGIGDLILINAPNVPAINKGGAGIKKGKVALTP